MKHKPVIARELASHDVNEIVDYYLRESTPSVAQGFIDALQNAYAHLSRHPGTGSTRYAHILDIPNLRCWSLTRYPQLIFYVEQPKHVEVWRVLHGMRDIPRWMSGVQGDL